MGRIESSKPQTAGPVEKKKAIEPAKAATTAPVASPAAKPEVSGSGFDLLRKKLMSVSGRYAAHKPQQAERADLKEFVSGQRLAQQAGGATGFELVDNDSNAASRGKADRSAVKSPPQAAAAEALAKSVKVPANDPYGQHIASVRAELKKQKLPTSAEGVRVFVLGENDAMHGPAVVRTVAGKSTGLAPGADVQLSGKSTSTEIQINAHPRKAQFDRNHEKIVRGTATLDDLANQGVIVGEATLSTMKVAISDARARLPKPPDGQATIVNMSWGETPDRVAQQLALKVTNGPPGNPALAAAVAKWEADNGTPFNPRDEEHMAGANEILVDQIAEAIAKKIESSPASDAKLALEKELASARKEGILAFNSAGNDNMTGGARGGRNFSHDVKGMVTVGNVDIGQAKNKKDDVMAWESSDGQVEISAPGEKIPVGEVNGKLEKVKGTSFSSPYMAGLAALMIKANPKITPDQIEKILIDPKNSTPVDQRGHSGNAGLIDPVKAVAAAKRLG